MKSDVCEHAATQGVSGEEALKRGMAAKAQDDGAGQSPRLPAPRRIG